MQIRVFFTQIILITTQINEYVCTMGTGTLYTSFTESVDVVVVLAGVEARTGLGTGHKKITMANDFGIGILVD